MLLSRQVVGNPEQPAAKITTGFAAPQVLEQARNVSWMISSESE
jgi:hypothetical protein